MKASELAIKVEKLEASNQEFQTKNATTINNLEKSKSFISELRKKITEMEFEISNLQDGREIGESNDKKQIVRLQEMVKEMGETSEKKLQQSRDELSQYKVQLEQLRKKESSWIKDRLRLNKDLDELKKKNIAENKANAEKIETLENEIKSLCESVTNLEIRIKVSNKENGNLTERALR